MIPREERGGRPAPIIAIVGNTGPPTPPKKHHAPLKGTYPLYERTAPEFHPAVSEARSRSRGAPSLLEAPQKNLRLEEEH
jgi:hypothetical protein